MKVLKQSLLVFVFFISQLSLTAQNIDSLERELEKASSLQDRVDLLNLIAYETRTFDFQKATRKAQEAFKIAKEIYYPYGIGYSQYVLGSLLMDQGRYDSALSIFRTCLEVMLDKGAAKDLEDIYNNMGITYKRLGNLDSSNYYYGRALNYVTDQYGKGRLFINIGSNYIAQGELDSAAMSELKAIEIFSEINKPVGLAIAYLNLGNIHYKKDDKEWALEYYKKSLENAILGKHKAVQSRNFLNIGSLYALRLKHDSALFYFRNAALLQQGMKDATGLAATYRNIGESFLQLNRQDSAEIYFLRSHEIYRDTDHREGKVRINKLLSNFYLDMEKLPKALSYANQSVKLASEAGLKHELEKALDVQHRILVKQGNYQAAYESLLQTKSIGDSIFTEEKVLQINDLQTKYETEKKDQEIEVLSQQAKIQALEISQRNIQLVGVGVLVLVLILGGFIFYKQKQFRHDQAVANMEQRMLRSQMNPHFIFNALASIQKYIIESNTQESVNYLAKFGKLMRQILEHSREEFIPLTEEIDMLHNYFQIQQLRFKNKFDYKILLDDAIDPEEIKIPPLFAQPFIENAIEHGLNDKEKGGLVEVFFQETGNQLMLEIRDNGSGMNKTIDIQKGHKSLATQITKDRLALLSQRFKTNFSLHIGHNNDGSGVAVKLILPTI